MGVALVNSPVITDIETVVECAKLAAAQIIVN
jgi:hypothetical protein